MELKGDQIRIIYRYNEIEINSIISDEQGEDIKKILNGKKGNNDNPSCGFSQDIAFECEGEYFSIARDTCPIIKYNDKYITISEKERGEIERIFKEYGATFPCV